MKRLTAAGLCLLGLSGAVAGEGAADGAAAGGAAAVKELPARIRAARLAGEDFLAGSQDEKGAWGIVDPEVRDTPGYYSDTGITGFALVALAGAKDPARHAAVVGRGLAYLMGRRQEDGAFAEADENFVNYCTAMTLMALAEIDPKKYGEEIRGAARYIAASVRDTADAIDDFGGVRYYPENGRVADLNNTVYAAAALRRAEALGIPTDPKVYRAIETFASRVQNLEKTNDVLARVKRGVRDEDRGGFCYHVQETKANAGKPVSLPGGARAFSSYGAMTCAGILAYHHAGVPPEDPRIAAAWEWLERHYTLETHPGFAPGDDPARGQEGLYYYYHVLARACRVHGRHVVRTPAGERRWGEDLARRVLAAQSPDGSWVNASPRWFEGARPMTTALAIAVLDDCLAEISGKDGAR